MNLFFRHQPRFNSKLFDQSTFYSRFTQDLEKCQTEVIIESPFISSSRMEFLYPILKSLIKRNVRIYIITRDPADLDDDYMRDQTTNEILQCTELGIRMVLLKGHHHRKLAIIDRNILWEGSLNILSQTKSIEIMRRLEDGGFAVDMIKFLKLNILRYYQ